MPHSRFRYKDRSAFCKSLEEQNLKIPYQNAIEPLFRKLEIGSATIPNRFAVQPMEGFDSLKDGSPSDFTIRRYKRYAAGGSGMIWFEATSVNHEGRSNPHQLMISRETLDGFKRLVDKVRAAAHSEFGNSHDVFLILQITHSGRYSKPEGQPQGKVACYNPHLDRSPDVDQISDADLSRLAYIYEEAVELTALAGFDAVDIKACHGYLVHELLGAHTRKASRYGGCFENRTRFLNDVVEQAHDDHPELVTAVRLNVTDAIPYPYGFGVLRDGGIGIDLSEPKRLVRKLAASGCTLLNVTTGIPYHSPHYVRPFDQAVKGTKLPDEHPLVGVSRLIEAAAEIQREIPDIPIVGTGYSWLRQFYPQVGAAVLEQGMASMIGLGRGSFAYPDSPRDLMNSGKLDTKKTCTACSKCTELMRSGHMTGCVTRDKLYTDEYLKII